MKSSFWIISLSLAMASASPILAQTEGEGSGEATEYDSTLVTPQQENPVVPQPFVHKHLLRNRYDVVLPGDGWHKNLTEDEMADLLNEYAQRFTGGLDRDDEPTPIKRGWSGITDGLSKEIESILGETEKDIMNGIRDEIEAGLKNILGSLTQSTPLSAVAKLKKMVKEGLSKQQKIDLQNYKANYEWKAAQTDLSKEFVDYYKELNLKDEFTNYYKVTASIDRLLTSGEFTARQQQMARQIVHETKLEDLADQVKIITNKSKKPVWMAEADRVRLLDEVYADLQKRAEKVKQLSLLLMSAYSAKKKTKVENQLTRSMYKTDTKLNGYVRTLPK